MQKLVRMVLLEVKSIKYEGCIQCQTDSNFNLHVKNWIEKDTSTGHHCVLYKLNTSSCEWEGNLVLPQVRIHQVKYFPIKKTPKVQTLYKEDIYYIGKNCGLSHILNIMKLAMNIWSSSSSLLIPLPWKLGLRYGLCVKLFLTAYRLFKKYYYLINTLFFMSIQFYIIFWHALWHISNGNRISFPHNLVKGFVWFWQGLWHNIGLIVNWLQGKN